MEKTTNYTQETTNKLKQLREEMFNGGFGLNVSCSLSDKEVKKQVQTKLNEHFKNTYTKKSFSRYYELSKKKLVGVRYVPAVGSGGDFEHTKLDFRVRKVEFLVEAVCSDSDLLTKPTAVVCSVKTYEYTQRGRTLLADHSDPRDQAYRERLSNRF